MKNKLQLLLLILFFANAYSQNNLWKPINEEKLHSAIKMERNSTPRKYQLFTLNLAELKNQLSNAPLDSKNIPSDVIIAFPNPEGELVQYRIYEAPVMEDGLSVKFPGIKSYSGRNIKNSAEVIRFSITLFGLHLMSFNSDSGTHFIDTYTKDLANYIVYRKKDTSPTKNFGCEFKNKNTIEHVDSPDHINLSGLRISDKKFRTYRLAMACTIEYAAFHINAAGLNSGTLSQKKAAVLSAMVVTMTRVNGVFEIDMSLRMNLVSNNDSIIFVTSDSFDNTGGTLLEESQSVITATIGTANYDIGHTVSTGGGGLAAAYCPCSNYKAYGITGSSSPVGDPYDIDYVSHEMGHQWGAMHTFNNACGGNVSTSSSVEPGSGSTIMGYAGVCSPNIQNNSDSYFSAISIAEMTNFIMETSGSCGVSVANGNSAPVVNAGPDYTIPKGTAFILKGSANDANNDALTYCWEQIDSESSTQPPVATSATGPNFRSKSPSTSPDRYMPTLASVVAGNLAPAWEVIPNVARTMNFALTVRDNRTPNGGQTGRDDTIITVANVGPFTVTSQNTTTSYPAGSSQNITWNVAGTTANGINCAKVNIFLSTDGGLTFPTLLANDVTNDGSETITIPNMAGTKNRIMVIGSNHIFYDISNANFTITTNCTASTPTNLAVGSITSNSANVTWNAVTNATYNVQYRLASSSTWTTVTSNTNSIALTNLSASSNYQVKVSSVCSSGTTSSYTSASSFSTLAGCTASTPTSVAVGSITSNSANVTWNAVTNATYNVQYRLTSSSTWTTVTSNTNSIAISNLSASSNYQVKVSSVCANGTSSSYTSASSFTTLAGCTASTPTNLAVGSITYNSANVSWNGSASSAITHEVQYRLATSSTWTTVTTSGSTSKALTNLSPSSAYQVRTRSVCSGGSASSYTSVVNFTTLATTYCAAQGDITTDEYIGRVQFNTINKTSGASGYSNFTSTSTTIKKGTTYVLKITPVWPGTVYSEDYTAWIDYNKNNAFEDNEKVMENLNLYTTSAGLVVSENVTIPASATNGTTRMRVKLSFSGMPSTSSCGNFEYGEVEDYTVTIVNANGSAKMDNEEPVAADKISAYPNPTEDRIFFTSADQINHIDVFNMLGEKVYSSKGTDQVDTSNFTNGLYIVKLQLTDNSEQVLKIVKK